MLPRVHPRKTPPSVWRDPAHFIAFGFGTGAVPYAPGTFGTLPGVAVVWAMAGLSPAVYATVACALFGFGVWICARTSRDIGVHDHPGIVLDEIVGFVVTMTAVPVTLWTLCAGFVLFRFFDIVKPWPIRYLDRNLKGGLGIMLDDVAAGACAAAGLHLILIVTGA